MIDLILIERTEREPILEDRRNALATCLQTLSETERLLVEQRYAHRTTVHRMAAETGCNVATLYKTLERVRRRLFECINRRLGLGDLTS